MTQEYLSKLQDPEGVRYVGKAQEKACVVRTQRRVDPRTGAKYPWLVRSTAMVNHLSRLLRPGPSDLAPGARGTGSKLQRVFAVVAPGAWAHG